MQNQLSGLLCTTLQESLLNHYPTQNSLKSFCTLECTTSIQAGLTITLDDLGMDELATG